MKANYSNEEVRSEIIEGVQRFLHTLENATEDELRDIIKTMNAYGSDFSTPMGRRRITRNVLTIIRKELKQFG